MDRTSQTYRNFVSILNEELVPAFGCTEPIAIALAAARARELLGERPRDVVVEASGSIIKNVKSVVVPNTQHLKGIPAAAAAGIVAGDPSKQLEVIASVTPEQSREIEEYLREAVVVVKPILDGLLFDLVVTALTAEGRRAVVRIANHHTNIVYEEVDGAVVKRLDVMEDEHDGLTDRSELTLPNIWDFVCSLDVDDVRPVLKRQIDYNMAIAEAGLKGDWGANIGSVLLDMYGDDVRTKAKAWAAAGSDARMNGCELPVVINSGSGNQGITVSVPVIVYAREYGAGDDELLRALALSNLTAIHQKDGIGRLSAFCGAVSAAAGAGAGIAYIVTKDYEHVIHTIVNTLAVVSGIVCDGAKASCAAKIASSVDSAILAFNMYVRGQEFRGGDGIVTKGVENTIGNVNVLGREGMKETNDVIIRIMTETDGRAGLGAAARC